MGHAHTGAQRAANDVADDAEQLTAALHALAHDPPQRDATLELLHASLNAKTLRDVEPGAGVRGALRGAARGVVVLRRRRSSACTRGWPACSSCARVLARRRRARQSAPSVTPSSSTPCWRGWRGRRGDAPAAGSARGRVKPAGVSSARRSTAAAPTSRRRGDRLRALQALLHWADRELPPLRPRLRPSWAPPRSTSAASRLPPPGLRAILELVAAIGRGFGAPTAAHRHCCATCSSAPPAVGTRRRGRRLHFRCTTSRWWAASAARARGAGAPRGGAAAAPRAVARAARGQLGEGGAAPPRARAAGRTGGRSHRRRVCMLLAPLVGRCAGSENSRVAERAASLFANDVVRAVLLADYSGAARS